MKYKMYGGKTVPTDADIMLEAKRTGYNAYLTSLNLGWSADWLAKRLGRDASLREKYNSARDQHFIELEERALREAEGTGFNTRQVSLNLGKGRNWVSNRLSRSPGFRLTYNKAKEEYESDMRNFYEQQQ